MVLIKNQIVLKMAFQTNGEKDENKTPTYGGKSRKFIKNFVLNQYNYRLKIRTKVHDELLLLFNPRLILEK